MVLLKDASSNRARSETLPKVMFCIPPSEMMVISVSLIPCFL